MKYLLFPLILLLAVPAYAQQVPTQTLVEEVGEVCSDDLMARMDMFLNQLSQNPLSKAVVIFHGRKDTQGRNAYLASSIEKYSTVRGFDPSRINVIHGDSRESQLIQFWLVPPGVDEPKAKLVEAPTYSEPALFDRARVQPRIAFNRWTGSLDIYSGDFWDLGCDFDPNRSLFAETLNENPNLNAFLIVYTSSKNRSQGVRIASFALNDLVRNFGVKRNRIRAFYGGTRTVPEIEFWLVPRGHQPPQANPKRPPIQDF